MPVLKRYAESYEKDGYYVHAPISDLDFPLPLQTPTITANIYKELGYGHLDNVPNELTWKMYDVGLHWTENSGPRDTPDELSADDLIDDGPALTERNIDKINSLIDGYSGEYQERVKNLQDQLKSDTTGSNNISFPTPANSFETLPESTRTLINKWEPSGVISEGEEGTLFSQNRGEFREKVATVSDVTTTVEDFHEHPMSVSHITTTKAGESNESVIRLKFETTGLEDIQNWSVTDMRPASIQRDFEVGLQVKGDRSYTFKITDGYIGDFGVRVGYGDIDKFDLPDKSNWIYEVEGLNKDEVHHALLSDFIKSVPLVSEFFIEAPFYAFEPIDSENRLVNLPTNIL